MKSFRKILSFTILTIAYGCGPKLSDAYHMKKDLWDKDDYNDALRHIEYAIPEEQGYPRLSDPLTAPVFNKLVDKRNILEILGDETLGIEHRRDISEEFFRISEIMIKTYGRLNVQDKFTYPVEMVRSIEFHLYIEFFYFKLGNEAIRKTSLTPDDPETKRILLENEQIIVDNFTNSIEYLRREDALNEQAIEESARIIESFYLRLVNEYPSSDFSKLRGLSGALKAKVKSESLKSSLDKLIKLIDTSSQKS